MLGQKDGALPVRGLGKPLLTPCSAVVAMLAKRPPQHEAFQILCVSSIGSSSWVGPANAPFS